MFGSVNFFLIFLLNERISKDLILIVSPSAFTWESMFSESGFQFSKRLVNMLFARIVTVLPSSEMEYILKQSRAFFVNHSDDCVPSFLYIISGRTGMILLASLSFFFVKKNLVSASTCSCVTIVNIFLRGIYWT